jgi:hypothetical protein
LFIGRILMDKPFEITIQGTVLSDCQRYLRCFSACVD